MDRIYNVYLPQEHFALFESHLRSEVFPNIEETVTIQRMTEELGRANSEVNEREGIEEDAGIAAAAYENDVPIYCPAVQDSVLGLQAWMYSQTSDFQLDALTDMTHLTDLAFEADNAGAMVVGGGVPKNYVLQTMLVVAEGLRVRRPVDDGPAADRRAFRCHTGRGAVVGQTRKGRAKRLRLRRRDDYASVGRRRRTGANRVSENSVPHERPRPHVDSD